MMLIGVFAAATSIALASTQIDLIGGTNLPTIPKTSLLEPKPEASQVNTVSNAIPVIEKVTYSDPGVSVILADMEQNASVTKFGVKRAADTDPSRRSAIQFAKDDENATDWIK